MAPRIPKRNARFMDTEGEMARGMSALEALRGYAGAPSQASVMVPGALSAYEGGELAGMAEMLIPGASMAKGALGAALAGVIKHRGGNWIPGDVESSISNLLRRVEGAEIDPEMIKEHMDVAGVDLAPDYALNRWIEGPLTKYIKRDMATPEDPVRRLADEGILHMGIPQTAGVPSTYIRNLRVDAGFPQEGLSETPGGSLWENLSDRVVSSGQAKYLQEEPKMMAENPWMQKLDPESTVYGMQSTIERGLGFDHLIDELGNAMNPGSGLPRNLLLRPEQMQQMGMEKAVRHVDAINKWRAAQQAAANAELANKAAVLREYPDTPEMPNPKGLRWVELKAPDGTSSAYLGRSEYEDPAANELAKQLKYEGDTMRHCVGGYCEDVLEGRSRIFSLRDAKGEPHVTIETRPMDAENLGIVDIENVLGKKLTSDLFDEYESQPSGTGLHEFLMKFHPDVLEKLGMGENSLAIHQIKGKQNQAPKDDYLPFVQDFVRNNPLGGSWVGVGDLRHTGLRKVGDKYVTLEELKSVPKTPDGLPIGHEPLDDLPGWKDGGIVEFPNVTPKAMLNRVISAYNAL